MDLHHAASSWPGFDETREDLVKELKDLLNKDQDGTISDLQRVVIETSGLADPAPILFTILSNPVLQYHYEIEHIITTVDAVNAKLHLEQHEETAKQIVVATKIVITKNDLIMDHEREEIVRELSLMNPTAQIVFAVYGNTDFNSLFSKENKESAALEVWKRVLSDPPTKHIQYSTKSLSLTFDQPIDWNAFGLWFSMLLHANGEKVMRVKGLLDVGEPGPVLLNGVQHIIHPPEHMPAWPDQSERRSLLVFIMKSIESDELLESLHAFQNLLGSKANLSESVFVH